MRIAVPKESAPRELRVALVPESCKKLIQAGYQISVQEEAGTAAGFPDLAGADSATLRGPETCVALASCDASAMTCVLSTSPLEELPGTTVSRSC